MRGTGAGYIARVHEDGLMRINSKRAVEKPRGRAGWRAVTIVLLLAFTLQSFVTQTHLHALPPAGAHTALEAPHHGKTPLDEGQAACPFCQATVHAGAFFAPATPVLVLPASRIGFATFVPVRDALERAFTHAWYSRAPPHSAN